MNNFKIDFRLKLPHLFCAAQVLLLHVGAGMLSFHTHDIMLHHLDYDCILYVFRFLHSKDLRTCRTVCWGFRVVLDTEPYAWSLLVTASEAEQSLYIQHIHKHKFVFHTMRSIAHRLLLQNMSFYPMPLSTLSCMTLV